MSRGRCRRPVPPPLEALSVFYRFLAEFEPLRQITSGVRSILFYGAQGDACLARGWGMMAVGVIAAGTLRLRGDGLVPPGAAPRPRRDEAREDRRPGVAKPYSPARSAMGGAKIAAQSFVNRSVSISSEAS